MLPITFKIFGRKGDEVTMLFHWCRDETNGLARARREAREFGMEFDSFFAEPYTEEEA